MHGLIYGGIISHPMWLYESCQSQAFDAALMRNTQPILMNN